MWLFDWMVCGRRTESLRSEWKWKWNCGIASARHTNTNTQFSHLHTQTPKNKTKSSQTELNCTVKETTRTCQSGFTSIIHKQSSGIADSLTFLINVSFMSWFPIRPSIGLSVLKIHSSIASVFRIIDKFSEWKRRKKYTENEQKYKLHVPLAGSLLSLSFYIDRCCCF